MNSPDILKYIYSFLNYHDSKKEYIYSFLNYHDSKKLLVNKEFTNILHKNVQYEYLAAKKIAAFFIKNNNINPFTKKNYIRYIIRKYNDEEISCFNNAYSKILPYLSIEQNNKIIPIANIIHCTRRDIINFLNILTLKQIKYLRNQIQWYNYRIYEH